MILSDQLVVPNWLIRPSRVHRVRNLAIGKRETWKHGRRKRKREWGSGSGEGKMRIKAKMLCEIPGAHLCFDERATWNRENSIWQVFCVLSCFLNRTQAGVATSSGLSVHHDSLAMHQSSFCSHGKDFGFNANQSVTCGMPVILWMMVIWAVVQWCHRNCYWDWTFDSLGSNGTFAKEEHWDAVTGHALQEYCNFDLHWVVNDGKLGCGLAHPSWINVQWCRAGDVKVWVTGKEVVQRLKQQAMLYVMQWFC